MLLSEGKLVKAGKHGRTQNFEESFLTAGSDELTFTQLLRGSCLLLLALRCTEP